VAKAATRMTTRTTKNDFGTKESVKLVLAKAERGLHATRTMLKAHLAKETAQVLPLLKKHFSEDEQAKLIWSFLEKFPTEKVTGILEWVFREMMMMMREDEHEYLESLEMYLRTSASENVRRSDGAEIEIEEMDRRRSE